MRKEITNLKDIFIKQLELMESKDKKYYSVWDIAVEVLSKNSSKLILTLKADLLLIRLIVEGYSQFSISKKLGIPAKDVFDTAKLWGLTPLEITVDINPLSVYRDTMTADAFLEEYTLLSPIKMHKKELETVINNILQYKNIVKFLEEMEEDEKS